MLGFLLPLKCLGCGAHIPGSGRAEASDPLCLDCTLALRPLPWPRCPRCDLPRGTGPDRPVLCGRCNDWPPVLSRAVAAVALAPPADALVQALKYGGWDVAAAPMGRRMVHRLRRMPEVDFSAPRCAVVPVPTTPARVRTRGYNQAERLARIVARELGSPLIEALARRPSGPSQVALQAEERKANVQMAFGPGPAASRVAHYPQLILVDDVLTTGSTAGAAASALAGLGAKSVIFVVFARTLPRPVAIPVAGSSSTFHP